jgi:DNA ligase (NAD+)
MPKASPEVIKRLNNLKKTIERHRYFYHVLDKEEISPAALDSLKHELSEIEEKYPELITPDSPSQRIAGEPLKQFKKVVHKVSQWSFNDAFSPEAAREFDKRTKKFLKESLGREVSPTYTVELKIDGLKIVLDYEKGILKTAATRGNGKVGEDVTLNVKTIESVPLKIKQEIDIVVEGEVWMAKSSLNRLNKERAKEREQLFANPRNAAAGSIRQLDPKIMAKRDLDTFIYDVAWTNVKVPKTQFEELGFIKDLGFKVNKHYKLCSNIEEIINFWQNWQKKSVKEDYLLDGVVVKVNEKNYQEILGYTGKAPRFAVALKFPAEQVTTVVEDIILQVGRTGILTPVAHLKPVSIAGSTVSRATLHNEDEIKRLDVRIGDTVILQKAGDVIPDIVSVVKEMRSGGERKFIWPKKVAECGGNGRIERISGQAAWRCVNKNSFAQRKRKFYHFVGKTSFDIDGLGPKIINQLLDSGLISSYPDIFTLKKGDLLNLPRFAEKSVDNLLAAINKGREITFSRFIASLSIPLVGEETAIDLANRFNTPEKLEKASLSELKAMNGVGPKVAEAVASWFKDQENKKILKRIKKEVTVKKDLTPNSAADKKLAEKTFVLTGALNSMAREQAKKAVREQGGKVLSLVSSQTDFVVAGAEPGAKLEKAKELGIKILDEKSFLDLLKN